MLLPALNSAREKGRSIKCLNNLKQCGMGHLNYAMDYGDMIIYRGPNSTASATSYWAAYLGGESPFCSAYLPFEPMKVGTTVRKRIVVASCPSAPGPLHPADDNGKVPMRVYGMPVYNYYLGSPASTASTDYQKSMGNFVHKFLIGTTERGTYWGLRHVKRPSGTMLLADSAISSDSSAVTAGYQTQDLYIRSDDSKVGLMLRHAKRANAVYMDGHAENKSAYEHRDSHTQVTRVVDSDNKWITIN